MKQSANRPDTLIAKLLVDQDGLFQARRREQSFLGHVPQGAFQTLGMVMGYSLFALEVSGKFGSVPEAAQRVHAVQYIRVQLRQGQDPPHTHPPRRGLLWSGLIPTTPK